MITILNNLQPRFRYNGRFETLCSIAGDEQKATPGFVDKFQKGVNTMVKFGRTV